MKQTLLLCFLLACSALLLAAQNPAIHATTSPQNVYHPGDTVWIDVHFDRPADISQGELFFQLLGQAPQDQQGLEFRFGGKSGQVQKVSSTEYRIGEKVPGDIASGQYRLYRVQATVANMRRGYDLGSAFHNRVVIHVVDRQITIPPKIQSLKLVPGKK